MSLHIKHLFKSLDHEGTGNITVADIRNCMESAGIGQDDARLNGFVERLNSLDHNAALDYKAFEGLIGSGSSLFERSLKNEFIIPGFSAFRETITELFAEIKANESGDVASYIPQLARVLPEHLAVSICTVDGQQFSLGDSQKRFSFQSSCKPILYCAALEQHGADKVHEHIGREPSGLSFNELTLNPKGLPHNPMINAGAIMSSSLIYQDEPMADRFDQLGKLIGKLSGNKNPGFDNAIFHSERETADRNFALAHYMREVGAFPEGTDLKATLDLYFSACSILTTSESMASVAATFANGGVCPITDERVFADDTVKNCLSMMYSCGMYDYSGEFAFSVGIPAKSAVSGVIMAVIPNVMGIAVWSPRLDQHGNSVRGVEFLKQLVATYNFHNYDSLLDTTKQDPRRQRRTRELDSTYSAIYAASTGDISELRRLVAYGHNLDNADYDGRTPLHLAAAEGQIETVQYLLNQRVDTNPQDRWKSTPLDDAKRHKHPGVAALLNAANVRKTRAGRRKNDQARKAA